MVTVSYYGQMGVNMKVNLSKIKLKGRENTIWLMVEYIKEALSKIKKMVMIIN